MMADPVGQAQVDILALDSSGPLPRQDQLAVEEPLEIRLTGTEPVITMRTPGRDRELVAGLLMSEGLAQRRHDFAALSPLVDQPNIVHAELASPSKAGLANMARSSLSNSACGVCGKKRLNLEMMQGLPALPLGPQVSAKVLATLPEQLAAQQQLFADTGGLHAAALFDHHGKLLAAREDIGRHNALDKLNGWALLNQHLPLHNRIVLLSGRASFELMQKCIMASAPIVCAISAPSSYAVQMAREFGVTLVGFLRDGRFNIYSAPHRILGVGDTLVRGLQPPSTSPVGAGQTAGRHR